MKRNLLIIAFTILFLNSCKKDFLDSTYNASIIREDYISSIQACSEYLNGIYLNVSLISGEYTTIYPEVIADNIKVPPGQSIMSVQYNWKQQANEDQSAVTQNINQYSYSFYRVIAYCNYLIQKVTDFRAEQPALADEIKGQCYAIRALLHFQLVNYFAQSPNFTIDGSHPGVVYSTSADWYTVVNKRNTVAEVYQKMTEDLKNAIELLPGNSTNTLYIGKMAAKSILARVLLFKEDYLAAKNLSREVALAVPLMQVSAGYPNDMYKLLAPAKTEVMFQLVPGTSVSLGHNGGGTFAGAYYRTGTNLFPTTDVIKLLTERNTDVRKSWIGLQGSAQIVAKFPTAVVADVLPVNASYFQVAVRSSEMFLTAAESYAKLNMPDSARFFLDAVRKRADNSIASLTASGAALLDSVYKERRKELCFEGFRMYDLLRWKKGVSRQDASTPTAASLPYPSNYAIAPIPGTDVKLSGLQQNLGY